MSRLNWNNRQSPTDFDATAPPDADYSFDYRHNTTPGGRSWPEKFGPRTIADAWKAGLVVVAEIKGLPHPVAVTESHWNKAKVLEVKVSGCWQIPQRIWTRTTVKGLDSTGLLVEGG